MNQDLYALLAARAQGKCECGCGRHVPPGEVDHFFSRARAPENEFTCWVITPACHRAKTDNRPNASHWLLKFIRHCGRWSIGGEERTGYVVAAEQAQKKLEWVTTKESFA